jgi:hypothetical protein
LKLTKKDNEVFIFNVKDKKNTLVINPKTMKSPTDAQFKKMMKLYDDPKYKHIFEEFTYAAQNFTKNMETIADVEFRSTATFDASKIRQTKILRKKVLAALVKAVQDDDFLQSIKVQKLTKGNKSTTIRPDYKGIMESVGNLETFLINRHVQEAGKRLGIDYVPFYFYFDLYAKKTLPKTKGFSNFYEIYLLYDEEYIKDMMNNKISFMQFLTEKGEHEFSRLIFRVERGFMADPHKFQNIITEVNKNTVLSVMEESKLKELYNEFDNLRQKNPDKYVIMKDFRIFNKETEKIIPQSNAVLKIARLQNFIPALSDKGQQFQTFTPAQAEQLRREFQFNVYSSIQKITEPFQNMREKKMTADAMIKWLKNEKLFYESPEINGKLPMTMLSKSDAKIKFIMLEALDLLNGSLSSYLGKELDNPVIKDVVKKQVEEKMGLAGITKQQVEDGYKPQTAQAEKIIRFPNIEAILFWWIRSGQHRMQSPKLKARWSKVKYRNLAGKASFLNSLVFMIASKIYTDKIRDAKAKGIPFKTVKHGGVRLTRTVRIRRSANYARKKKLERRIQAKIKPYEAYSEWRSRLIDVNPEPDLTTKTKIDYSGTFVVPDRTRLMRRGDIYSFRNRARREKKKRKT